MATSRRAKDDEQRLLIDADEASALLGISKKALYSMARDGEIAHLRVGRYLRFRRASLEAWVRARETPGRR